MSQYMRAIDMAGIICDYLFEQKKFPEDEWYTLNETYELNVWLDYDNDNDVEMAHGSMYVKDTTGKILTDKPISFFVKVYKVQEKYG